MTAGERLARVQRAGHGAIDALAAPMAHDADRLVRRYWPFTAGLLLLFRNELRDLIIRAEPALIAVTVAASRAAEIAADPAAPVDVARLSVVESETALSLAKARPSIVDQTTALITRGIAIGLTLYAVAKTVRQYFYKADPATGLIQSWPGRANMGLQFSRSLMLNQATAGHFWGMRRAAIREGWMLRFSLSPQHKDADQCDSYAGRIFAPDDAPRVPTHYGCRCHYETVRTSFFGRRVKPWEAA